MTETCDNAAGCGDQLLAVCGIHRVQERDEPGACNMCGDIWEVQDQKRGPNLLSELKELEVTAKVSHFA